MDKYPCIQPVTINFFWIRDWQAVYFLNIACELSFHAFRESEFSLLWFPFFSFPYSCPIYLQRNFRHSRWLTAPRPVISFDITSNFYMVHVIDVLKWLFTLEFWLFEGLLLIWVIKINFVHCPRLSTFDIHSSVWLHKRSLLLMYIGPCIIVIVEE